MKDHSYWSHVDFSKEKGLLIKQNIICRQQRLLDLIIYKLQIILMKRKEKKILNSSGQLTQGAQSSEQPLFSESHDIKGI